MTSVLPRIGAAVQSRLRTTVGKRFSRFVLVAVASLGSSLVTLSLLLGVFHLSGGLAGILSAIVGAAVSYVLSRWAWERKGRPHLLKETLPFWLVSLGSWTVLGLTSHYARLGCRWATPLGAGPHRGRRYLVANCVTFLTASRSSTTSSRGPRVTPESGFRGRGRRVPNRGRGPAPSPLAGGRVPGWAVRRPGPKAPPSDVVGPAAVPERGALPEPAPGADARATSTDHHAELQAVDGVVPLLLSPTWRLWIVVAVPGFARPAISSSDD